MQHARTIALLIAGAAFLGGGAYIVYSGRPVVQMEKEDERAVNANTANVNAAQAPEPEPAAVVPKEESPKDEPAPKSYTMTEVQAHATPESCWSAINGSVYDLTTWISRHPGGPDRIIKLCGTDGSKLFEMKHGGAPKQQAVLVLLKIGALK